MSLAAQCKAHAENPAVTDAGVRATLERAAAVLSIPTPSGIVTRDDIDSALGCMDAIATSFEQLYASVGPIIAAVAAEAARANASRATPAAPAKR